MFIVKLAAASLVVALPLLLSASTPASAQSAIEVCRGQATRYPPSERTVRISECMKEREGKTKKKK